MGAVRISAVNVHLNCVLFQYNKAFYLAYNMGNNKKSTTPFPLEEYLFNEPPRHQGHKGRMKKKIGNFIAGRE
jgi:hypothetical protein